MSEDNYIKVTDLERQKAKTFFTSAAGKLGAGQYDYGIEMMISGLKLDPEAIDAHQTLRDASLRRKAGGGKKMGMFEAMKYSSRGKDERVNLANAERLLAFDPGDTGLMLQVLESAYKAGCFDTVLWIAPILTRANNELAKPEFSKFEKVRDHYAKLKRWSLAVEICTRMVQMKPDDLDLKNDLKNLSAEEAMNKGKYHKNFSESIRDADKQSDLLQEERDVVGDAFLAKQVKDAEAEVAAAPQDASKVAKLVEALRKLNTPAAEERAGKVLFDAYERTGAYRFRSMMIDMRIKQLHNEDRTHRGEVAQAKTDADKAEKIEAYKEFTAARAEEELTLLQEVAEQYPSEPKYKYEVANRMVALKRYTDAIPLYQVAVNDPKLRNNATLALGRTFLAADFPDEAVDTLKGLAETYPAMAAGDEMAKQIMYWLGRSHEEKKEISEALKAYSMVVKWDFNYVDTQVRMKKLRAAAASA